MRSEKENLEDKDINVDSLWLIGPRAKNGKHQNVYHGNFVPQIPNQMLRRYTKEGDTILEMFMGSGTTLYECETLNRNYIGFDINQTIIDVVQSKMTDVSNINFYIHNCDVNNGVKVSQLINEDLEILGRQKVDHIIIHPPYLDIIKFTQNPEDLSAISNVNEFINRFVMAVANFWPWLENGKYCTLIIGDLYRDSEVVPLAFYLMYAIKKNFQCKMKGIVIKDIEGNRGKIGNEALWRYRALKSDTFIFKHEYIFVFKKTYSQRNNG